jgi:hypothetical protein
MHTEAEAGQINKVIYLYVLFCFFFIIKYSLYWYLDLFGGQALFSVEEGFLRWLIRGGVEISAAASQGAVINQDYLKTKNLDNILQQRENLKSLINYFINYYYRRNICCLQLSLQTQVLRIEIINVLVTIASSDTNSKNITIYYFMPLYEIILKHCFNPVTVIYYYNIKLFLFRQFK